MREGGWETERSEGSKKMQLYHSFLSIPSDLRLNISYAGQSSEGGDLDCLAAKAAELNTYFPTADDDRDYDTIPDDYDLYKKFLSHESTVAPPPSYNAVVGQEHTGITRFPIVNQATNPMSAVCSTVTTACDDDIPTTVTFSSHCNVQESTSKASIPGAYNPLSSQASEFVAPNSVATLPRPMENIYVQEGDNPDRQTSMETDADEVVAFAAQHIPEEQAAEEDDYIAMRSLSS